MTDQVLTAFGKELTTVDMDLVHVILHSKLFGGVQLIRYLVFVETNEVFQHAVPERPSGGLQQVFEEPSPVSSVLLEEELFAIKKTTREQGSREKQPVY